MKTKARVPGLISLKQIIESTSAFTGKEFFQSLVMHLSQVLDIHGVWITEFLPNEDKLNSLAFWLDGKQVDKYEYYVKNTPCETVLESVDVFHVPKNVIKLYPKDPDLTPLKAVSYMGISLRDTDGTILGHLAVLDNKPMPEIPEVYAIFKIFASRAAAELRRLITERKLIENESKLNRLVNGTSDAIIELNSDYKITQCNEASSNMFKVAESDFPGKYLKDIFVKKSLNSLLSIIPQHKILSNKHNSLQLSEPLICITNNGTTFPSEVNISCYEFKNEMFFVLYIRNIEDKISDRNKIAELHVEASMLKEKIYTKQFDYIIGDCEPIIKCIDLVNQVAPTNANVLIHGETGTGKELFAKAIHEASNRKDKPMIILNCAALSAELIESELFGHVKGAFTGAISNREGRFSLADNGTIFLDEIAELPLLLQAKLLRVIQEGTYEPIGSSVTKNVDVRVIAATHRDLKIRVNEGLFREDLFFRLNVFPISIPPLRERGKDLELLANAFILKYSINKAMEYNPLTKTDANKLYNYHWPGNVRELQNIIERLIIISQNERINIQEVIPFIQHNKEDLTTHDKLFTDDEIKLIEKNNIIKALNLTNWKISGKDGAAQLLNIPRTTLTSKIVKLGIKRLAVG